MQTVIKRFSELTNFELYEILRARAEIFVVEQNCPYQDLDEVDYDAYHVYFRENGKILAYLRVIDKGKRLEEVSIGRVISVQRRKGYGLKLMKVGLQVAKEKFGATVVKIGAQKYAKPFYEQAGFFQVSDDYMEDGIPHIYMLCKL